MTMPATMPEASGDTLTYAIDLPFPISANRLWRSTSSVTHTRRGTVLGSPRVHLSRQYKSWILEADALFLAQKHRLRPLVTLGRHTVAMTFSDAKRSPVQDGDNLCKCVNDWAQRVELTKNDCLCDAGSWKWGHAPAGCRIILVGRPWT